MNIIMPSEEYLKLQRELSNQQNTRNSQERRNDNMNRRATDNHVIQQLPIQNTHAQRFDTSGVELLKHIGTALVAMIPLGSAYMSLNNTVLESTIKIAQLQEDKKNYEKKLNEIIAKIEILKEENSALKEDIDSTLSVVGSINKRKAQEWTK